MPIRQISRSHLRFLPSTPQVPETLLHQTSSVIEMSQLNNRWEVLKMSPIWQLLISNNNNYLIHTDQARNKRALTKTKPNSHNNKLELRNYPQSKRPWQQVRLWALQRVGTGPEWRPVLPNRTSHRIMLPSARVVEAGSGAINSNPLQINNISIDEIFIQLTILLLKH